MAKKCTACGKFCATIDGAKCNKCSAIYHKQCMNISPGSRNISKWMCKECMNKHDLPVITDLSLPVGDEAKNKQNSPEQFQSPSLVDEIKLLRSELSGLRLDMTSFTAAIHEFNKRLGDVEARLLRLESQDMQASSEHTSAASSDAIAKLEARLNQSEQENLLNDVEVTGVVESSNENPIHVVITLAQKIGVELSEHDIVSAKRVGLRRHQNTIQSSNVTSKPRAIVVRLSRRHLRDELLRAARVRRGADTAGTGIGTTTNRFYINEHLTRTNRNLFYLARQKGHDWRFIWTRGGRIYARKDSNSRICYIQSIGDIDSVFGKD
ncbi:uncharacterized protein LOC123698181 [Colias croceus]|uniref:uncharacterized protein LOC123698181 n=1 Tax=Colias crocea TaxID=72248 RepID=UPI001E28068C|nr:uncharacterized protein LOC123698181 [Colias croceus]